MREAFISRNFSSGSLQIIAQANAIIAQYKAAGYNLTLRQLYYQFVARDIIANKQSEYKRLGGIIDDGRKAGYIDWDAIEDRTRELEQITMWDSPDKILEAVAKQYRENPWDRQTAYCEVWVEKDALVGVIEQVANRWRVPYFACRGYASSSELYKAGKRLARAADAGKDVTILHLGDHDPSGIDMTRANREALLTYSGLDDGSFEVRRLALNMDQVRQYNPPPNPAKDTDARFGDYAMRFGTSCWELDALDPAVIDQLIDAAIQNLIDFNEWDEAETDEQTNKDLLAKLTSRWEDVAEFLSE